MSTAQTWAILVTWLITFAIAIAAGVWSIAGFRDLTPKRKPRRRARDVADPRMSPRDFAAKIDEFRDGLSEIDRGQRLRGPRMVGASESAEEEL